MSATNQAPRFRIIRLEERIAPGAMGGFCESGSGKGSHKGSKKGSHKGSNKGSKKGSHKKGTKKGSMKGGCPKPPVCPPQPC